MPDAAAQTERVVMKKYVNFVLGFIKYMNGRVTTEEALVLAEETLKIRIKNREKSFLNLVQKGIYENLKSPYLKLLHPKKIGFNELKRWVEGEGLDKALLRLQEEGVYFTVDEYKGRTEVVRKNVRFLLQEKDFHNPFVSSAYEVRSGATRSAGTRIRIDFEYLVQMSLYDAFLLNEHKVLQSPIANWFPIFPGAPGINSSMRFARIGNPPKKWFTPVDGTNLKVNLEKRLGTNYILYMGRLLGVPMAMPELVDLNNAYQVAKWASEMLDHHASCVIYTFASSAVRVCLAAKEHNLNVKGTVFLVTGEPLTPQKKREIHTAGAKAVPVYGISEAGVVAAGCGPSFHESDHCHYYMDSVAIIDHFCHVPKCDEEVNALQFTSILHQSPKILLNVEMGDYGNIASGECSCNFGRLGYNGYVSNIRSYEKLTGEGVTFVNTDFVRIIEEDLPRKFGGICTDYQMIEEEGKNGLNTMNLLISPRIGEVDETEAINYFMSLLKKADKSPESWVQSGPEMWAQAGILRVKREYPVPTKRAKILPFHLVQQ